MNYDHGFHAGNFADVLKHVVLTRILLYLQRKPMPFRVIDTHAGSGTYDLRADAAGRTAEWRSGIGRLDPQAMSEAEGTLIAPYLALAEGARAGAAPYPGSPQLAMRLTRPIDRMLFCELHPVAFAALRRSIGRDRRAKAIARDGYQALGAFIPPVERRGLILVDPPFEAPDEFDRLATAILAAHAKWREGVILAWFPIKDRRGVERVAAATAGIDDVLRLELAVGASSTEGRLAACGLLVVNPPYTLEDEMACLLPMLHRQLGRGAGQWRMDRPVTAPT